VDACRAFACIGVLSKQNDRNAWYYFLNSRAVSKPFDTGIATSNCQIGTMMQRAQALAGANPYRGSPKGSY
jgi:hypothetical protein